MWKGIVLLVLLAGGVVAWLAYQQRRPEELVVSGIVEADQVRVGSRVGGRVAEVLAVEGQKLTRGAPLFKVEAYDLMEKLARAEAEARGAKAELARLKAGYRQEEIAQAKARVERLSAALAKAEAGPRPREIEIAEQRLNVAMANLELAQSQHKDVSALAARSGASQREMDQATRELKKATAEEAAAKEELALLKEGTRKEEIAEARAMLNEAQAALRLLEAGYRAEEVAAAEAKLAAAEAEAAAIRRQVEELTVTAPVNCTVEAIDLRPGDLVAPGAPAVSLLEDSRLWVRAYVPGSLLGRVKVGASVPVRLDAFPDAPVQGKVVYVSPEAEFTPKNVQTVEERGKQVYRIKVELTDPKARAGMMGDVLIGQMTSDK